MAITRSLIFAFLKNNNSAYELQYKSVKLLV